MTDLTKIDQTSHVNCKNLRQPCSSLRSPQSSSKSQTKSLETHRSFLQRNSMGEQVATKTNISTVVTKELSVLELLFGKSCISLLPITSCAVLKISLGVKNLPQINARVKGRKLMKVTTIYFKIRYVRTPLYGG